MGEYNPVGDTHIIRQSDAHSWVEAYFAGEGWTEFDPTPPAAISRTPGLSRNCTITRMQWDSSGTPMSSPTIRTARDSYSTRPRIPSKHSTTIFSIARTVGFSRPDPRRTYHRRDTPNDPFRCHLGLRRGSGGRGLAYLKRKELWNRWWLFRLRRTGRVDERVIDALFYRAVAIVGKNGPRRHPAETWREWIGIVPHERCRSILQRALEVFERSRYGPDPSSPADVATLQEAVRELRSLLQ